MMRPKMSISDRIRKQPLEVQPSDCFFVQKTLPSSPKDKKGFKATPIIDDCLFLGDIHDVLDLGELRSKGITHVVSCCPEHRHVIPDDKENKIKYLFVNVRDHIQQDVLVSFGTVNSFISDAFKENEKNKVIVHCSAGISRSVTFVVAFLTEFFGIEPLFALEIVSEQRKKVYPNLGFLVQLNTFFHSHKNKKEDGKD